MTIDFKVRMVVYLGGKIFEKSIFVDGFIYSDQEGKMSHEEWVEDVMDDVGYDNVISMLQKELVAAGVVLDDNEDVYEVICNGVAVRLSDDNFDNLAFYNLFYRKLDDYVVEERWAEDDDDDGWREFIIA